MAQEAGDLEKLRSVRAELERLLQHAGQAEVFSRLLRLPLQARAKPFDDSPGFRWLFLPLWICEALRAPWQNAVPAAAAVELMAASAEILDDLQDRDNPLSALEGVQESDVVNVSVGLQALAYVALRGELSLGVSAHKVASLVEALGRSSLEAAIGQHLELHLRLNAPAEELEGHYFQIAGKKSGAPLGCACYLGAVVATDDAEQVRCFAEYGRCLGVALQIANDLLYLKDPDSQKSDIRDGKLTLPVIYGLACLEGPERELLQGIYAQRATVTADAERQVKEALASRGALFYAQVKENLWRTRALEHLRSTASVGLAFERLEALARPQDRQA